MFLFLFSNKNLDGTNVAQQAYLIPPNVVRTTVNFGGQGGGCSPNAEFDDSKIYNRSLTPSEIKKVLNSYY